MSSDIKTAAPWICKNATKKQEEVLRQVEAMWESEDVWRDSVERESKNVFLLTFLTFL